MNKLINCLANMKANYLADPTAAVRSSSFIYYLHCYCVEELQRLIGEDRIQRIELSDMRLPVGKPHFPTVPIDPKKFQLMQEATLFGSHKNKDMDIVISQFANGPQIAVGVRSQMSSVGKNIENYYEGIIGECISLHDRFPMAVAGYVYLLPKHPIKSGLEHEEVDLDRAEQLFKKITGRDDWHSPSDRYEHFAFIKVDFSTDPPTLISTCDELSIETFFDKLVAQHNNRNFFNPLTN